MSADPVRERVQMQVTFKLFTTTVHFVLFAAILFDCSACRGDYRDRVVHSVSRQLPSIPSVDVTDADKFLNDLKLSPYWKVEKNREGKYEARARSIGPDFGREDGHFLFELFSKPTVRLPKDWRIGNHYIDGDGDFSSFSATIVFQKPSGVDFPHA
jgi:hypothetical protein